MYNSVPATMAKFSKMLSYSAEYPLSWKLRERSIYSAGTANKLFRKPGLWLRTTDGISEDFSGCRHICSVTYGCHKNEFN